MTPRSLAALLAAVLVFAVPGAGRAAWPVFDSTNYVQNVLQAARALEQINNQIRALQNQAVMLENMARNLTSLDHSALRELTGALVRIDALMRDAEGLSYDLADLEDQWRARYPETYDSTVTVDDMAMAARERWRDAMDGWRHSMRVQSRIVEDIRADHGVLADLVTRSQGAVGALQAQQAGNQLMALAAKQQMQLQTLLAAQARAEAQENARKAQAEEAARAATDRFLGDGRAYTPR